MKIIERVCSKCGGTGRVEWRSFNGSKTHCPQGHPYSKANTYMYIAGGGRNCRLCRRATDKARSSTEPYKARARAYQARLRAKRKAETE